MTEIEEVREETKNTERLDTYAVSVLLIVKAKDTQDARSIAAIEMNRWFTRSIERVKLGIISKRGTLLLWRYLDSDGSD